MEDEPTPVEPEEKPVEPAEPQPQPALEPVESRGERLRRHGQRFRLYTLAFVSVALIVIVIALAVENTRQVKLSWVVGTTHASLVWIVLAATVLGWLLGLTTGVIFRLRTRRRHPR
jgi:uncharacterized integral membrane protein